MALLSLVLGRAGMKVEAPPLPLLLWVLLLVVVVGSVLLVVVGEVLRALAMAALCMLLKLLLATPLE
jgi:hypothetical protein